MTSKNQSRNKPKLQLVMLYILELVVQAVKSLHEQSRLSWIKLAVIRLG